MIIIINFVNNLSYLFVGFFRPANLFSLLRGGVTIEFSEMRGPNKIFWPFILLRFYYAELRRHSPILSKNGTYDNLNLLYKNKVTSSIVTFQISNISYRTCNSDVILFFSRSPNTYFSHCIAARGN